MTLSDLHANRAEATLALGATSPLATYLPPEQVRALLDRLAQLRSAAAQHEAEVTRLRRHQAALWELANADDPRGKVA